MNYTNKVHNEKHNNINHYGFSIDLQDRNIYLINQRLRGGDNMRNTRQLEIDYIKAYIEYARVSGSESTLSNARGLIDAFKARESMDKKVYAEVTTVSTESLYLLFINGTSMNELCERFKLDQATMNDLLELGRENVELEYGDVA